jgi:putative membrane protein
MMYGGGYMNGWGYALMGLSSLLFWVVLVVGGFGLFRYLKRTDVRGSGPARRPEQILADRYARGEIDDEEYSHRLSTLRGADQPAATR